MPPLSTQVYSCQDSEGRNRCTSFKSCREEEHEAEMRVRLGTVEVGTDLPALPCHRRLTRRRPLLRLTLAAPTAAPLATTKSRYAGRACGPLACNVSRARASVPLHTACRVTSQSLLRRSSGHPPRRNVGWQLCACLQAGDGGLLPRHWPQAMQADGTPG